MLRVRPVSSVSSACPYKHTDDAEEARDNHRRQTEDRKMEDERKEGECCDCAGRAVSVQHSAFSTQHSAFSLKPVDVQSLLIADR